MIKKRLQKQISICSNCGAQIDREAEKCPHCGAMHYPGAEKKYMGQLEDIREELEKLGEVQEKQVTEAVKKAVIFAVIICFFLILLVTTIRLNLRRDSLFDQSYEAMIYQRLMWQDRVYPLLDNAYEDGAYDVVSQIYSDHIGEDGSAAFYQWKHSWFMEFYDLYQDVISYEKDMRNNDEPYIDNLVSAVELAGCWDEEGLDAAIKKRSHLVNQGLTKEECDIIRQYREYALSIIGEYTELSLEEVYELVEQSTENYGFSRGICRNLLEARKERQDGM